MKSYPRLDDPMLNLVFSIYHNPGVYALLIGSGVSRTARIPTGWEVTLDLIRKTAKLHDVEPEDPEKWYIESFGKEPDYSELLEFLAKTQHERKALLNAYFEPSQEEIDSEIKVPTKAHIAIASLVNQGYIRVILTTNFDRLLEQALEKEGVIPDVIYNEDTLKGIVPLIHSKCMIIKLHGDYKDTRIKNTSQELAHYSKKMNELLDRILDEFGLIVCGWSGQWDTALRGAILRCPSRRFTTYWAYRNSLTTEAEDIIKHRRATKIHIEDADRFFTELKEKIAALQKIEEPHPFSIEIAVERMKKYLSENKYGIELQDQINNEVEKLYSEISSDKFDTTIDATKENFQRRLKQYESVSSILIASMCALSYYDEKEKYAYLLTSTLERLSKQPYQSYKQKFHGLELYPALLLIYSTGISALARKHYKYLAAGLLEGRYKDYNGKYYPLLRKFHIRNIFNRDTYKWVPLPNVERRDTPEHEHISNVLREFLLKYLPDDDKYQEIFDIFEYLLGLIYSTVPAIFKPPFGCFLLRYTEVGESVNLDAIDDFFKRGLSDGLLEAGFFDGSIEKLQKARTDYDGYLKTIPLWQ
ncbi:MAG TPA: hypothetical protein ENI34_08220 [candidate division WOR-3 bacterium]|uniref:SIR2-like domain-containing protein n=1 Tax=candidate division WOR-3 bacterium TaxID=2052148 RepID=A0A9C9K0H5_UNCW3|nr:hypothetical protein [candidate division WOR-3 bacterium]